MKAINTYINEKLVINKDSVSKAIDLSGEFIDGFYVNDVIKILQEYTGIKKDSYNIEKNDNCLCMQFNDKLYSVFGYNIMSDLEKEIKNKKLNTSLYVTGDMTLNKPEIYINKY